MTSVAEGSGVTQTASEDVYPCPRDTGLLVLGECLSPKLQFIHSFSLERCFKKNMKKYIRILLPAIGRQGVSRLRLDFNLKIQKLGYHVLRSEFVCQIFSVLYIIELLDEGGLSFSGY